MLPKCWVSVQTAIQYSPVYTAIQVLEFVNFLLIFFRFFKILLVSKNPPPPPKKEKIHEELCS